ncbi:MAG: 23S rRNA (guanosine(2251)-2'-O)-methyltransferase RlmB [Bacilli bacterium]|nr:23S rRNA (guanosine(2251)-2'-O)-methyltransferase RlmB [Bacilli bacterium]
MRRNDSPKQLAYGRNNVLACLDAGIVIEVYYQEGFKDEKIEKIVNKLNLKSSYIKKKELNDMTAGNHQGVAALVKSFKFFTIEEVLIACGKVTNPLLLIIDEIKDPHNLGAIIRSAEAFGVTGIIMKKDRQVGITPTVMKVATGAQNDIMISQVVNLNQSLEKLKKAGFWIVSTDLKATKHVADLNYDFKTAVIVGNEEKGVSPLLTKSADFVVKIPMLGKTNSLNVSVATGIILALIRQKQL